METPLFSLHPCTFQSSVSDLPVSSYPKISTKTHTPHQGTCSTYSAGNAFPGLDTGPRGQEEEFWSHSKSCSRGELGRKKDFHEQETGWSGPPKWWKDQIDQQLRSIAGIKRVPTGGEPRAKNIKEDSIEMHLLAGLPQGRNFHVPTFPSSLLSASPGGSNAIVSKPWGQSE